MQEAQAPPHGYIHLATFALLAISKGWFALWFSCTSVKFGIKFAGNPKNKYKVYFSFSHPNSYLIFFMSMLFVMRCLMPPHEQSSCSHEQVQHEQSSTWTFGLWEKSSLHFRQLLTSIVYLYMLLFTQLYHAKIDDCLHYSHFRNQIFFIH